MLNIFIMVKYTNEQRLQIIKVFYRNSESVTATLRALTPIFGRNSRPSRQAITSLVQKFESTYSLCDVAVSVRQRVGQSVENIAAVRASVANDPNQSIPRRSQELDIAQTTLWRILREQTTADTEIKKTGRPKKRETDNSEVSPKNADASNGDSEPPAKRGGGRPPKGAKVTAAAAAPAIVQDKVPGRGRGRPPKNSVTASKKKQKEKSESEGNVEEKKESLEEAPSS